jgi:hypothetical protein
MICDYLKEVVSDLSSDEILAELNALWEDGSGDSRGAWWTREDLHERTGVL